MSSIVNITGSFSGGFVSPTLALPQIAGGSLTAFEQVTTLSTGANTITVPAGAVGCLLTLPSGNTVQLTLKGVTGDTGIPLHLTNPAHLPLGSAASTFCLTAASAVQVALVWY